MKRNSFPVILIFFLLCFCSSVYGGVVSDKSVLLEFKSFVSDPHGILSSWNSSNSHHCSWLGVTCNLKSRVVSISITGGDDGFEGNSQALSCSESLKFPFRRFGIRRNCSNRVGKLEGKLSPLIGKLSQLRVLSLPYNELSGEIPLEIWGLEHLEVLDLEGNLFTGKLPCGFVGLRKLRVLNLGFNRLDGEIPISLSKCAGLEFLNLAGNKLKGSIPRKKCQYLQHLDVSGNSLFGGIPDTLGNCRQLRTLLLFSNKLNGEIPRELGQLGRLEVLDISRNLINGVIPAELDYNPSQAKVLWAPRVTFEGKLPSNWGGCESLEMVNLAHNGFGGEINGIFGRCKKLYYLDLSSNMLSGQLDEKLPVPCMTFFDVSQNLMSSSIPRFNYDVCPRVPSSNSDLGEGRDPSRGYVSFLLYKTRLANHLPFSAATLAVIHNYGGNNFTGPIRWLPIAPERLAEQTDYAFLASRNKLTGSFPGILFGKCDKLHGMIINVSKNQISGLIPLNIGSMCGSLRFLDASENQIAGSIPQSIGDLKFLVALNLSGNKLQGQIPASLYRLKYLKHISLAGNNLIGAIPSGLGQLDSLQELEISPNSLSGKIPQNTVKLENLTSLLLDNSKLSAQIPSGFNNVRSLSSNGPSEPLPLHRRVMNCSNAHGNPFPNSCDTFSFCIISRSNRKQYGSTK
ncbi:hypothetical protein GH714_029683 [Hevea brasiliensis]|uniref:Uncharacterized protein n=1 Tax=Hevea brasiliensis TaxID=3981 RepID=A0A6A6L3F6_HEVBR|nr:hypothetical protein GH714_029683 [Hevea brasiliensis]